jgi:sirohydrochlorin cobaltochelatase
MPRTSVELAFLELMQPDLPTVAARQVPPAVGA